MGVPTIIDCDPGVDDVLGLLLALSSPSIELIALYSQFGNTDASAATNNILKMYGVIDRHCRQFPQDKARFPAIFADNATRPLVIKGAEHPIEGAFHTAAYFHGRDGLGDITNTHPSIEQPTFASLSHLVTEPSEDTTILSVLAGQPDGSVNYIALGPLTNLALALKADEALFKRKVKRVTIMGGALDVPGNTSPTAEFNIYADASAAHYVFGHSGSLPIYLAPLDITTPHTLPWTSYASLVDPSFSLGSSASTEEKKVVTNGLTNGHAYTNGHAHTNGHRQTRSPLVEFTSAFLTHTREIMEKYGKDAMELHDPLAIWFAIEHAENEEGDLRQGWEIEVRDFTVERRGEYTTGMLVVDRRASADASGEKGQSRAKLQEAKDREGKQQTKSAKQPNNSYAAPAQVDDPSEAGLHVDADEEITGVNVITKTPGYDVLAQVLFEKIWGVQQQ